MRNKETRILLAAGALALALVAFAIEAPKPAAPATSPSQPREPPPAPAEPSAQEAPPAPAPKPPRDDDQTAEQEEDLPPLPAGTVPAGPPAARFEPSEKVRADFPVSFPIDI